MQQLNRLFTPAGGLLDSFPPVLVAALYTLQKNFATQLYISGGTVRDWLLGRQPADLDIAVAAGAENCCRELQRILQKGTFVALGTDEEEAARLAWQNLYVDISSFRKNALTIEEELCYRDFTVNSLAVELHQVEQGGHARMIDPLEGANDLAHGILRNCPGAFLDDPLRMLRGYRLAAELGLTMSSETTTQIRCYANRLSGCAAERILAEMNRIMATPVAAKTCLAMAESGLLWQILPELETGVGVEQPGYHHKDVFHHSVLALASVEEIIAAHEKFFPSPCDKIKEYLSDSGRLRALKWAALLHDLGKPSTRRCSEESGGRVTFYNHDRIGRKLFENIADRLRMSREGKERVAQLVEMHMHPFHLSNAKQYGPLSRKALLKICKKAGDELAGLFVLAMADSLAGQGELKPPDMEDRLRQLYGEIEFASEQYVQPVISGERLVSGHDLINDFDLQPGPMFRKIFADLEIARVEGIVVSREDAYGWLRNYLETDKSMEQ